MHGEPLRDNGHDRRRRRRTDRPGNVREIREEFGDEIGDAGPFRGQRGDEREARFRVPGTPVAARCDFRAIAPTTRCRRDRPPSTKKFGDARLTACFRRVPAKPGSANA